MYEKIERVVGIIVSVLMFMLMMLTFVDVMGRDLFNAPLRGASEATEILLALIIFMILPQVAVHGLHITIDLLGHLMSDKLIMVLEVISAIASSSMFVVIGWQVWVLGDKARSYADVTATLGVPLAPIYYVLAVMSGLIAAAFLLNIPKLLRGEKVGPKSEEEVAFKA